MGIFKRLTKSKNPDSKKYRREMAEMICGQHIKYVTERRNDNDDVIGRGGALTVKDDYFIVDSSGDRIFMCKIAELDVSMLMSGDGVIIKGPDLLNGGAVRSITVHFVYYRK